MKTKLIFAMPGVGKTSFARKANAGYEENQRPVIDYDYKGRRFPLNAVEVARAQAVLFEAFSQYGTKAILSFPNMVDWRLLDPDHFDVYLVIPKRGEAKFFADRTVARGDDPKQWFVVHYLNYCEQWRDDWAKLEQPMRSHFGKLNFIEISKDTYLSDIIDPMSL